ADIGLSSSTTYYYKISAYNVGGQATSAAVSATTSVAVPPAAPTNLTATPVSSTKITLNWTSNSGGTETGFKIYYSTNGAKYSWGWTTSTGVTTITPALLTPSTTYYFKVVAYNAGGNSDYSNVASAATMTFPAAPSNLTGA